MIVKLKQEQLNDKVLQGLGASFFEEARLPGRFDPQAWHGAWTYLMQTDVGAIWAATIKDVVVGALGAVVHPDINDGKLVAQEAFWFMDPNFREGLNAVRLYNEFEAWAREKGAVRICMASILTTDAPKVRKFYTALGFRPIEVNYHKDL